MASFELSNHLLDEEIESIIRLEMEKYILDLMFLDPKKKICKDDILDALEELFEKEGSTRRERRKKLERLEWCVRRAIWSLQGQYIIDFTASWDLELKLPDGYLQSGTRS